MIKWRHYHYQNIIRTSECDTLVWKGDNNVDCLRPTLYYCERKCREHVPI